MSRRPRPLVDQSGITRSRGGDAVCKWLARHVLLAPDSLDLAFRLEKAFDLKLPNQELLPHCGYGGNSDVTAGELYDWVVGRLAAAGRPDRCGNWRRFRLALAEMGGGDPRSMRRDSLLNRDLKLYEGG